MTTVHCNAECTVIAISPFFFFQRADASDTLNVVSDIEAEKARLAVAQ